MEEWKKAWAAGVIDFQGHIQRKRNGDRASGSMQVVLYVDTSIEEITNRLAEMTGANLEPKVRHRLHPDWMRRGCEDHCPEAHIHMRDVNMPETARWTVTGAALAIVLWNLRPYMTTDREPWDWALQQCLSQMRLTGRGSAAVKEAATRLHSLGWDLPPVMEQLAPKAIEMEKVS